MNLKEDLLRGIYGYGFEKPSAIQQRAVKPILMGRDVIAQAQSGKKCEVLIASTIDLMIALYPPSILYPAFFLLERCVYNVIFRYW